MKNNACKFCGSVRCAQILYGRIVETKQLREALTTDQVVLQGSLFSKGMPQECTQK